MKTKITEKLVNKLIDTVLCGLVRGLGKNEPGKMCVEAAVCFAYGLPHNDNPPCVGSAVRSFKITLNDSDWSSNRARAAGMIKIAIAQLGSNEIDQAEFSKRLVLKTINKIIGDLVKIYLPKKELEFRNVKDLKEANLLCLHLKTAAADAACVATAYAANGAAYADSAAADAAASYAAHTAIVVANAAAYTANGAYKSIKDDILTQSANICLEVLQELKSPGCEFLYLLKQ